jgi:hypothetical protein
MTDPRTGARALRSAIGIRSQPSPASGRTSDELASGIMAVLLRTM